jgi:hypothetical protein
MSAMQTIHTIRALIDQCSYPGFEFIVSADGDVDQYPWFQLDCPDGTDTRTGKPLPWKGRKWKLSWHMTDTEVVQTVWAAIQRAILHEASELFLFTGVAIYDRHINVHALANFAADPDILDGREEPEAA